MNRRQFLLGTAATAVAPTMPLPAPARAAPLVAAGGEYVVSREMARRLAKEWSLGLMYGAGPAKLRTFLVDGHDVTRQPEVVEAVRERLGRMNMSSLEGRMLACRSQS